MFTPDQLQAFKAKIDSAQTIALFGHHNIDGDAIGSVLGFGTLLEKLGKKVSHYTTLAPGKSFNFVKGIEKIKVDFDYAQYDLICFLDFTGYHRISSVTKGHEEYFNEHNLVVVDHHIDDVNDGTMHATRFKEPDASSNCELLLELCHAIWPTVIDADIATHWYMGVLTDTGIFQYQQDSIRTFGNAMKLIEYGANKDYLIEKLFNSKPKSLIDFMKLVTPRIQFSGKICSLWYTLKEVADLGLDSDEAEAVMIFVRSIYGLGMYVEIKVEEDRIRLSMRSGYTDKGRVNVQQVAQTLGGGGHMYAAGCAVPRNPDLAIEEQISIITSQLNAEVEKQLVVSS